MKKLFSFMILLAGVISFTSCSDDNPTYTAPAQLSLQRADACWQYIKQNLIDYEHGEWYWSRRKDGTLNLDDDHAGFWKCPYHNSRMCLETMERFAGGK